MKKLVELFFTIDCPSYGDFFDHLVDTFDFELAEQHSESMKLICDTYSNVTLFINGLRGFTELVQTAKDSRKDQASDIISTFDDQLDRAICFGILDGREINIDTQIKLVHRYLNE